MSELVYIDGNKFYWSRTGRGGARKIFESAYVFVFVFVNYKQTAINYLAGLPAQTTNQFN